MRAWSIDLVRFRKGYLQLRRSQPMCCVVVQVETGAVAARKRPPPRRAVTMINEIRYCGEGTHHCLHASLQLTGPLRRRCTVPYQ